MIKSVMSTIALAMVAADDDTFQSLLQSRPRDDLLIVESQEDETVLKRDFGMVTRSDDIANASIEEVGLHDGQLADTGNVAMEKDWREEDADAATVPNLPIDDLQHRPEFALMARRVNVSHKLSKCEVSKTDVANAVLSAVDNYLDEPEFCWRHTAKRWCKVPNARWEAAEGTKCPEHLGTSCVHRVPPCETGSEKGKHLPCCEWSCPPGFDLRGNTCWQKCQGATSYNCGPWACAQHEEAHVAALAKMALSVVTAVRETILLLLPPAKAVTQTVKVAQATTKSALRLGAKAGLKKLKAKLKKLKESAQDLARVFTKVKDYLKDKPGFDVHCGKQFFDLVVGELLRLVNEKEDKDMDDFDFTKFDPTGFATAIKKSVEGESKAEQAAAWLEASGQFDPTGWLSAAASFSKPLCEFAHRSTVKFSIKNSKDHKSGTTSRVEASFDNEHWWQELDGDLSQSASTNTFSLSVPKSPESVTIRILGDDAWAFDSLKIDDVEWLVGLMTPQSNWGDMQWLNNPVTYASHRDMNYKMTARTQVTVLAPRPAYNKDTDRALCLNFPKHSIRVGPNNVAGCAAALSGVEGCGSWFDYESEDGQCNCIKKTSGECKVHRFPYSHATHYAVYKFQIQPTIERIKKEAYCTNRGGKTGSNKYSINVGPNNLAFCAAHLNGVIGCGWYFNYGSRDGWCDCVPVNYGRCIIGTASGYTVQKFIKFRPDNDD